MACVLVRHGVGVTDDLERFADASRVECRGTREAVTVDRRESPAHRYPGLPRGSTGMPSPGPASALSRWTGIPAGRNASVAHMTVVLPARRGIATPTNDRLSAAAVARVAAIAGDIVRFATRSKSVGSATSASAERWQRSYDPLTGEWGAWLPLFFRRPG